MYLLKKYGSVQENIKDLQSFKDFLEKCMALNPKDRITPQ